MEDPMSKLGTEISGRECVGFDVITQQLIVDPIRMEPIKYGAGNAVLQERQRVQDALGEALGNSEAYLEDN